APGTGLGGVVDDRVDAGAGGEHRLAVGEVAAQLAHADGVEFRVVAAAEAGDLVSPLHQPAAERLAEESAAAGHQYPHLRLPLHRFEDPAAREFARGPDGQLLAADLGIV